MSDSEDVEMRCRSCGVLMGTATVRSQSRRTIQKVVWLLRERLRCPKCEQGRE